MMVGGAADNRVGGLGTVFDGTCAAACASSLGYSVSFNGQGISPAFFFVPCDPLEQRYRIFLFPRKSSFFTHFWAKPIEWMKKLFFFFRDRKKKKQLWDRMNEWTCELFQEKKKQKKCQNFRKKKTTHFVKNYVKPVKFWMNGVWTFPGKKKQACIFFSRFAEKKTNTIFCFEWMNDPWTFPRKKKIRYLWYWLVPWRLLFFLLN